MRESESSIGTLGSSNGHSPGNHRIVPTFGEVDTAVESDEVWGFTDSFFEITGTDSVILRGGRYPLSGQEIPNLIPWMRTVMDLPLDLTNKNASQYSQQQAPPPVITTVVLAKLTKIFGESGLSIEPHARLRHGHGHSQAEMYALKFASLSRIPDVVVWPSSQQEVTELVELAKEWQLCLIPYGGGTNVSEALLCPDDENRTIVSIDMKKMSRIRWIDPVNMTAEIEAGAVGRNIIRQLAEYGFTIGHEPDSVEFSTLGGWIATNASGMKKNRYGNIEDIVLDVKAVSPAGVHERFCVGPRQSIGVDAQRLFFGSEGNCGVIISAVVKLFKVPEVQKYGSVVFPSFEHGVNFLYEATNAGILPASIRLVDNIQFQFGLALKPKKTALQELKSKIEKFYVTKIKGLNPQKMVACTLVFEGNSRQVSDQETQIYNLAKKFKGFAGGASNGENGYQLTFSIAYIRDFVMNHHILAESFETSVPWSRVLSLCNNVKQRISDDYRKAGLPGKPFVSCRVTQMYNTGVCVYFYLGIHYQGVDKASELFSTFERNARAEILKNGGTLSHHHGIGKIRRSFLGEVNSITNLNWVKNIKATIDPQNIFGSANIFPSTAAVTNDSRKVDISIPAEQNFDGV